MITPAQLALKAVWKGIEIGDNANYSKKEYPTDSVEYKDIPYIADGNSYHLLDVYVPREFDRDGKKHPVIIDIHGGGWYYGTKELNRFFCLHLARKGFIVFNMSYRLAPKATWIDQVQDCPGLSIKAIGLTSPATYLDPSAGAIWKFYFNSFNKDFEKETWYPYLNFDSTVEVCGKAYPPTHIVTSVADIVHSAGVRTYKTLKKAGIPAEINDSKNPKLMHVYMVTGADLPEGQAAIDGMTGFFQKYI